MSNSYDAGLIWWNDDFKTYGKPTMSWLNATFNDGKVVWFSPAGGKYQRHNIETGHDKHFEATEALQSAIEAAMQPEPVKLISSNFADGESNMLLSHPNVALMVAAFAKYFDDAGGVNFVEVTLTDKPSNRTFVITTQLATGKTPWQKMKEAEAKVEAYELDWVELALTLGVQREYVVEEVKRLIVKADSE